MKNKLFYCKNCKKGYKGYCKKCLLKEDNEEEDKKDSKEKKNIKETKETKETKEKNISLTEKVGNYIKNIDSKTLLLSNLLLMTSLSMMDDDNE